MAIVHYSICTAMDLAELASARHLCLYEFEPKKSSDPGSNQGPQDNKFSEEQGNYSLALFQLSYQRS
ncbi:hypothetical protein N7527_001636 [Penicillium freii]|nr:hypothetical protein N7527_001636 [Penicillium freii]